MLGTHWERDELGGGLIQHTQYIRRVNYRDDNGNLRRIVDTWEDSGNPNRPHIVTRAPFMVSVGKDGKRRIHPTREMERYFEIGSPFVKVGGAWTQVNLGAPTRTGNLLKWTKPHANMYVRMGGHFVKLAILLKHGWVPEDSMIAFPVGLTGLTRNGGQILRDGVPVMHMRPAHVEDYDNPDDVRPVAHKFVRVGGQWHVLLTLPSLAGMSRPLIDPTITLQPDAAAGKDTSLVSDNPTTNYGTVDTLLLGERSDRAQVDRTLIHFDLSTLPDNAVITSATLSLYAITDYSTNDRIVRVFRQKRAWIEAQATWNIYSTGNNWQTAGGFGANDCEQTDIGNRVMAAAAPVNQFYHWSLTPTTKSGLDLGNGWLLKVDTEAADCFRYASSDHVTPATRPKLTFVYFLPSAANPRMMQKRRFGF